MPAGAAGNGNGERGGIGIVWWAGLVETGEGSVRAADIWSE